LDLHDFHMYNHFHVWNWCLILGSYCPNRGIILIFPIISLLL
jgi:hypothetical protein